MAYQSNPYAGQGGGYGQPNPYESQQPSYGQQSYGQQQSYNQSYNQGGYGQHQQDLEMQPLPGQQQQPYSQSSAPTSAAGGSSILNECRAVSSSVDSIDPKLAQLQSMQDDFLRSGNTTNRDIEAFSADIMATYRELAGKVKRIKSKPAAGERMNKPQVDLLDKRIKTKIADYQKLESAFREKTREQQARQYRIVNPQASEAEVREATYDGGDVQVFQQALLNSNRQGQAQSTLRNVQQRHDAIQQIEKTMLELQQLFQDLDQIVVEQEPLVQNIEQKAEETNTHLVAGNTEVGKAVKSARAARKKKWICLGIVVAIIIIVIIIVFAYLGVTGKLGGSNNNNN